MKNSLAVQKKIPLESLIIGVIEFNSIAKGIKSLDSMVKVAPIKILDAKTISPGRYLTIITGDLASVEESINKGVEIGEDQVREYVILANLHMQIIAAMMATVKSEEYDSVGIIETKTVISAIISADQACKTTDVILSELRLANGLGGNSFFIIKGELYDVESALEKAIEIIHSKETLINYSIVPSLHEDLKHFL